MSLKKTYPRHSTNFSSSVPGRDPPAIRIVDQRNLIDETKISSTLFKSKKSFFVKPVSIESHFRQLIEHDEAVQQNLEKMSAEEIIEYRTRHTSGLTDIQENRLKYIGEHTLQSPVVDERIDAARILGSLLCPKSFVIDLLGERLKADTDERVKFQACKALVRLGCLDGDVVLNIMRYLMNGNRSAKNDLLVTMIECRTLTCINQEQKRFGKLCEIIERLSHGDDPSDQISFHAAVCLVEIKIKSESVVNKLIKVLKSSKDPRIKALALTSLVNLDVIDADLIDEILMQLKLSSVWKFRRDAARHLTRLGLKQYECSKDDLEKIYFGLKQALWDEVNQDVRTEAAKALTAFNMLSRACTETERDLQDGSDLLRAQAVICVGTLVMKIDKIIRVLMDLLQLDPSEKVQKKVIETFLVLDIREERVSRLLKTKSVSGGQISCEAKRALDVLSRQ